MSVQYNTKNSSIQKQQKCQQNNKHLFNLIVILLYIIIWCCNPFYYDTNYFRNCLAQNLIWSLHFYGILHFKHFCLRSARIFLIRCFLQLVSDFNSDYLWVIKVSLSFEINIGSKHIVSIWELDVLYYFCFIQ